MWEIRRNEALSRLEEHLRAGRVDQDIVDLLRLINSLNYAFTTSSCSGRIQLYEAELPGSKFNMRTLGKWHRPISLEELKPLIRGENLWMAVLPPILHMSVKRGYEPRFLQLLRNSGFKRAGIISVSEDEAIVEASGTERLEAPLIVRGVQVYRDEALPLIVERANQLLLKSKDRLRRLKEVLSVEVARSLDNIGGKRAPER